MSLAAGPYFKKRKLSKFWEYLPLGLMLVVLGCFAVIWFNMIWFNTPTPTDTLPDTITPAYRAVENTGGFGRAEYYIFGTDGTRYPVTQKLFDQYKDLPRESE